MWFCPLHWLFPHTSVLCASADLSGSRHLVLCTSYMGRAGLPAWAGLSHLNKLGCCSAVRGQVMALLLSTNFEYDCAQCYRTALLQCPRTLAMTDIVTTAITTDPSLSCKSRQSVHSHTAALCTHAQRELPQVVSKLPACTGSLQKVWCTHGWDILVGKNLLAAV